MYRQSEMNRRHFLAASVAALLAGPALASGEVIEVYKSPRCGCCSKWITHLRANSFDVKVHDIDDVTGSRAEFGVPRALGSCHTARIGDYLVEGHVPAREIRRLLAERPDAAGLAVPGMPRGSPGMEADVKDAYDVLLFQLNGRYTVYQQYGTR
jgi:hypothetical protein